MAFTTQTASGFDIRAGFDRILSAVANALVKMTEVHSRRRQIDVLNALSDERLAEMGLTRDGIVAHVFRDKIYL